MFSEPRVALALMTATLVFWAAPQLAEAGTAPGSPTPYAIAIEADEKLVVTDQVLVAVERIDPDTGVVTILSDFGTGSGPFLLAPLGIAVEDDGNLVVTDDALDAVIRVDPVTGDRTIVSDVGTGTGPGLITPFSIEVEADGNLVVVDGGLAAVIRVDPVSGDRTIVSDAATGTGPGFLLPFGIAIEDDGNLVVTNVVFGQVLRVDPVSGDRTIVSDAATGSGPALLAPFGIAVEADGSLVVADTSIGLIAVVRVDPVSGDRTILSDASTGSGPDFLSPIDLAPEASGSLVVTDNLLAAVVRVNPVSGNRNVLGAEQTILGEQMKVKNRGNSNKRSIIVVASEKDSGNTIVGDPSIDGATVEVIVSGDNSTSQTFSLPQGTGRNGKAFWVRTRDGFVYKDKKGVNGAIKEVTIEQRDGTFYLRLKANGKNGPIDVVPADLTSEGGIILELTGGGRYCVTFGQDAKQSENSRRWRAKRPSLQGCPFSEPPPLPSP